MAKNSTVFVGIDTAKLRPGHRDQGQGSLCRAIREKATEGDITATSINSGTRFTITWRAVPLTSPSCVAEPAGCTPKFSII